MSSPSRRPRLLQSFLSLFIPPPPGHHKPLYDRLLLFLLSFLSGASLIIQTGSNVRASAVLGHSFRGSIVSNVCGLALSAAVAVASGQIEKAIQQWRKETDIRRSQGLSVWPELWLYSGGLFSAAYICVSIYCVSIVGYSIYFVFSVTGQIMCGLVMDQYGMLGYAKRAFTVWKALCAAATMSGALMILDYGSQTSTSADIAANAVLAFAAGAILPLQAGVNKQLISRRLAFPLVGVFFNNIVSVVVMVILNGGLLAIYSDQYPLQYNEAISVWWQWIGGIYGCLYVLLSMVTPQIIGVSVYVVTIIGGQLFMSVLSDSIGVFGPVKSHAYSAIGIAGVLVAFIGASGIAVAKADKANHAIEGKKDSAAASAAEVAKSPDADDLPLFLLGVVPLSSSPVQPFADSCASSTCAEDEGHDHSQSHTQNNNNNNNNNPTHTHTHNQPAPSSHFVCSFDRSPSPLRANFVEPADAVDEQTQRE